MCDAASATMAVASVAQAGLGYQSAKNASKLQTAQYEANRANAITAANDTYKQNAIKAQQEKESAAQQLQETTIEGMRNSATASVAAGESGATGISLDRVLRDAGATTARERSDIQTNADWSLAQINQENIATQTQEEGRINSMTKGQSVSALPYLIQAGMGALSAYSSYQATSGATSASSGASTAGAGVK